MNCHFCGIENSNTNAFCCRCGARLSEGQPKHFSPDWEEKGSFFGIPSFFITIRDVLFSPAQTFRNLKTDNRIFNAFFFSLICGSIGFLCSSFWQSLVDWQKYIPGNPGLPALDKSAGYWAAMLFIAPCVTAIVLFFISGFVHLCLMIAGSAKKAFPLTFKVIAYTSGATALLSIIPVLGAFAGFVWFTIIEVIGLKEVHGNTLGRTLFAVFLPLVLCCGCCALIIGAAVFAGVAGLAGLLGKLP